MDSGFEKILGKLQVKEGLKEKLKELPFNHKEIPADELKALLDVRSVLNELIRRYEPPRGETLYREKALMFFNEAVRYLDGLPLWEYKFTTDSGDDSEKLQFDPEYDSTYYLTRSGVSLRLKKANLAEGNIKRVVSSFADAVFFVSRCGEVSREPREGYSVYEYITDEFHTLQEGMSVSGDFISPVKYHSGNDGSIKYVEPPQKYYHYHEGHRVNRVLFER